jgi:hypothetical protein
MQPVEKGFHKAHQQEEMQSFLLRGEAEQVIEETGTDPKQ